MLVFWYPGYRITSWVASTRWIAVCELYILRTNQLQHQRYYFRSKFYHFRHLCIAVNTRLMSTLKGYSNFQRGIGEIMRQSLEKSTKPFEAFSIPFFLGNATHKHLNRSSSFIPLILGLDSQGLTELIFWNSSRLVDFISEDHDRHLL